MEGEDNNPLPHIVLNDRSQLQGLDSLHSGSTIIVKLEDTEDVTSQLFQAYATSVNSIEKNDDETEIAFEIIQEPLLNENGNPVENRLYFDPDYHPKENLQVVSIERTKEDEHLATSEDSQSHMLSDFTVQELADHSASTNTSKVSLSTSPPSLSTIQNILPSASENLKLAFPNHRRNNSAKRLDILKKTTVEAFVKMIVCRKITIQKKDAKTGEILDVDVKMEEEEPVLLDVDCVETTEDSMPGSATKANKGPLKSLSTAAIIAPATTNAVSENSSKIRQKIFTNALLQSAIRKKLSKVMNSAGNPFQTINTNPEKHELLPTSDVKSDKINSASDSEWMEDLNDDSADYTPYPSSRSNYKIGYKQRKSQKGPKSSKLDEELDSVVSSGIIKDEKDTDIQIPKKRGRKRKWDKMIGFASNLKTCQFCKKHFDTVSSCNKHMKKGNCVSPHFCFICSKNFDSEHQLEVHIATHRDDSKRSSYDCMDCKRSYRTKSGYLKHFRMGTCTKRDNFEDGETGNHVCEVCNVRFSSLDYLQLHQYKVHENPKDRHVCPLCGKTFYSLHGFQRHRAGRPCTEPLKCHICGKTYKSKVSFKLHMRTHKSEITGITFNCNECGRSYMTEAALTKHKLLHTGVKPYKCDVCGKEFAMRYQVKDHSRVHSGEKPFSCSLCNVSFSNKGHLGRHLRSHENGTLLRRGRPKKRQETESNNKVNSGDSKIRLGQTLTTIDHGQMIRVIDSGQIFTSQGEAPAPMIIQADNNTIIIAEGWPENSVPSSQPVVSNNDSSVISG